MYIVPNSALDAAIAAAAKAEAAYATDLANIAAAQTQANTDLATYNAALLTLSATALAAQIPVPVPTAAA